MKPGAAQIKMLGLRDICSMNVLLLSKLRVMREVLQSET
jgi:hypothetical protein